MTFTLRLNAEIVKPDLNVDERAVLAATYMGSVQRKTGYFSYEFDFVTGNWSGADELVRQAGASYALSEYLMNYKDPIALAVVQKAILAYRKNSIGFKDGKLLTDGADINKAETGATALAMMGAIQYTKATDDHQFDSDIQDWKNGLLALYYPGKGFAGSPADPEESPYFNGEAWLALSVYGEQFPKDGRVANLMPTIDAYMMRVYSASPDIGFFHWGLIAAAKRHHQVRSQQLMDFSVGQVNAFLTKMRPSFDEDVNSCYSVEGMASILPVLQTDAKNNSLTSRLAARLRQEMSKNISMQITPGQSTLMLTGGRSLRAPELSRYAGAFINGMDRPQIRIDFTQHCLSALIKGKAYLK